MHSDTYNTILDLLTCNIENCEPSGCRWCGIEERQHASRFVPSVGQHLFTAPTAAQRLARMRARRDASH